MLVDGQRRLHVQGAVQKGPFLLGSSVTASMLDGSLNPTGQVFNTETSNDRGEFELDYPASNAVSLEGDGYYFDEVLGVVSSGRLTLRAFSMPAESDTQRVMINSRADGRRAVASHSSRRVARRTPARRTRPVMMRARALYRGSSAAAAQREALASAVVRVEARSSVYESRPPCGPAWLD